MPVLRATFLEQHIQGTGPKTGYSPMKRNQEQQKTERGWFVGCFCFVGDSGPCGVFFFFGGGFG